MGGFGCQVGERVVDRVGMTSEIKAADYGFEEGKEFEELKAALTALIDYVLDEHFASRLNGS